MRIWSLHPKYLDTKGLVALWRETLLAQKVLANKTKGYRNHPQLIRFKKQYRPMAYIGKYLLEIWNEAEKRGYSFDKSKIKYKSQSQPLEKMLVTSGQLEYEFNHLKRKLQTRDVNLYENLKLKKRIKPHPLFKVVAGKIAEWEIVYTSDNKVK